MVDSNGNRTVSEFHNLIIGELHYIRGRLDSIYDKHYLLYGKVIAVSVIVTTIFALVGWVVGK